MGRGRGRDGGMDGGRQAGRQEGRKAGIFSTHAHVRTYTYRLILCVVDVFCYIRKRMYACMHMHAVQVWRCSLLGYFDCWDVCVRVCM